MRFCHYYQCLLFFTQTFHINNLIALSWKACLKCGINVKNADGSTEGNLTCKVAKSGPRRSPSVSAPHFFWLISLFSERKKCSRWELGMLPERTRTAGKSKRRRPAFLWSPGRKFAPSTCLMHLACFLPGNTHAKSSRARPHTFTRNGTHSHTDEPEPEREKEQNECGLSPSWLISPLAAPRKFPALSQRGGGIRSKFTASAFMCAFSRHVKQVAKHRVDFVYAWNAGERSFACSFSLCLRCRSERRHSRLL